MLQLSFVNFRKNSYLLVEGMADSDRFYIIQSGKARVVREFEFSADPTLNNLGPGDFAGVIPCMSAHSQIESVVAVTDMVAISVKRDQYPALIEKNTPVALKIIHVFASRMRNMNESLMQLTLKSSSVTTSEQLYTVAAYYDSNAQPDIAVYAYYQYLKAAPTGANNARAKQRFLTLKPRSRAVHLETKDEVAREYPRGTMIFSESQSGQDMFIIQDGQVKITKVVEGNEVVLAVLKKGDFFGEMALLENLPRSASAIAHENCKLMVVNRKNFDQMVATQPQLISRLTTTLADRLWSMYRQLANTRIIDPAGRLLDMVALQIEKARVPLTGKNAISHQLDISPYDLANMCAIPPEQQNMPLQQFMSDRRIRIINNKIFVTDCAEVLKSSTMLRKQKAP